MTASSTQKRLRPWQRLTAHTSWNCITEAPLKAAYVPKKTAEKKTGDQETESGEEKKQAGKGNETEIELDGGEKARALLAMLSGLKKGQRLSLTGLEIREGETSPPRRYTSGSMILAMENAGQLIEDEELRSQPHTV